MTTGVGPDFVYNWDNKLRSASVSGGDSIDSIKYDPDGNRIFKESTVSSQSVKRKYIVDIVGRLPVILMVMDAGNDNSVTKSYVYANSQVLAQYEGEQKQENDKHFYLHDRLGSVRLMVDESGDISNYYTYSPYGEVIEDSSDWPQATSNDFMFTGQWYDEEIDQYYLRARQYDPEVMRFTSRDPVYGTFSEPMTLNVYLYCVNNPINMIDLTGLAPEIITYTMLTAEMETVYEDHIKGKFLDDFGFLSKYGFLDIDTKWAEPESKKYNVYPFKSVTVGITTTGEELNYVGVGMGFKHMGFGMPTGIGLVLGHNILVNKNIPKLGEIGWAMYGYFRYNEIAGKKLSFAEELFARAVIRETLGVRWP